MEELMLHNNKLTGQFPTSEFASDGAKSPLTKVTLQNNQLTGDVDEMCNLPKLSTFEVDPTIQCDCCTTGI
jgi:hypothetical protein